METDIALYDRHGHQGGFLMPAGERLFVDPRTRILRLPAKYAHLIDRFTCEGFELEAERQERIRHENEVARRREEQRRIRDMYPMSLEAVMQRAVLEGVHWKVEHETLYAKGEMSLELG